MMASIVKLVSLFQLMVDLAGMDGTALYLVSPVYVLYRNCHGVVEI